VKASSSSTKQRLRIPFLLPVRPTRWQAIHAWLWAWWQRWHTPRLEIQPPWRPARQKPFPQRPHHRRRQAVFAALAIAPPDATTQTLIAHVRAVTGIGCSPKLIAAWKRENRKSDGEKKWLALQLRLFLLLLAFGCTLSVGPRARHVGAQEIVISPAPDATPETQTAHAPRLLRLKLTLHSAQELRVKAGDNVQAGDVLSDHRQARQRLLVQKRALQTATEHLHLQTRLTNESLRQLQSLGLALPPTSYAAERAAIQRAETEAIAAQHTLATQQERLSVVRRQWPVASLSKLPVLTEDEPPQSQKQRTTDDGPLTTAQRELIQQHEEAKLTQAQDHQLLARAEIGLHQAKLTTAREARAWEEQKHRVEIMRQRLSVRSQQQQAAIEFARLTAQQAEIELQLAQLVEVRAPFAGTIKRIEWEEMKDEKLTVWVYLLVGGSR
jgi:hypothetical protein